MGEAPTDRRRDVYDQRFSRIENKLDQISESMMVLTRIEERQVAANERYTQLTTMHNEHNTRITGLERAVPENLGRRLAALEIAMPGLKELRVWAIMGILSGLGMMGYAVVHLVLPK